MSLKSTLLCNLDRDDSIVTGEPNALLTPKETAAFLANTGLDSALASKADLVGGKVPSDQLPSYVDDVIEFDSISAFPEAGEAGKIYVALDTGSTYRWSGTQYVQVSGKPETTLTPTSDSAVPTSKAVATYVASQIGTINSALDTLNGEVA